jgi:hypothetical protein
MATPSALALTPSTSAFAHTSTKDFEAARRLKASIEQREPPTQRAAEKYLLPVTRGFNQRLSQLCWAYSTLNALETLNLVRHPERPLELSRGYLQHTTWQDRLERRLTDPGAQLSDRGTAINAIRLIQEKGIAQFGDYTDTSSKYSPDTDAILEHVAPFPSLQEKLATIASDLAAFYGKLPTSTTIQPQGLRLSTLELGRELTGDQPWISYAVANSTHPVGWGADPDPDARGDYLVKFTPMVEILAKMRESLKHGIPLMYSNLAHLVMIYGAEYDHQGNALTFYIKDSYPGYFYQATPESLYREMLEVTTIGD